MNTPYHQSIPNCYSGRQQNPPTEWVSNTFRIHLPSKHFGSPQSNSQKRVRNCKPTSHTAEIATENGWNDAAACRVSQLAEHSMGLDQTCKRIYRTCYGCCNSRNILHVPKHGNTQRRIGFVMSDPHNFETLCMCMLKSILNCYMFLEIDMMISLPLYCTGHPVIPCFFKALDLSLTTQWHCELGCFSVNLKSWIRSDTLFFCDTILFLFCDFYLLPKIWVLGSVCVIDMNFFSY